MRRHSKVVEKTVGNCKKLTMMGEEQRMASSRFVRQATVRPVAMMSSCIFFRARAVQEALPMYEVHVLHTSSSVFDLVASKNPFHLLHPMAT